MPLSLERRLDLLETAAPAGVASPRVIHIVPLEPVGSETVHTIDRLVAQGRTLHRSPDENEGEFVARAMASWPVNTVALAF